ncbi:MAG: ATP phosphoribosyltransferase [Clostridiales bacterium]|nr:ATP phosphoribosyltransferase [Clostridiales bacterium]
MLNVALPKGRLGNKVYEMLADIGYICDGLNDPDTRKLVFENKEVGVRYALVKPSDVAVYVERGAADIGVVGKDTLDEGGYDVFELLDLGFGKCSVAMCAPDGWCEDTSSILRVATKYPNTAKRYYISQGREIDIIKLNGSIELAPILGLSDVIVDIVETGSTLRENHLHVEKIIAKSSARLIACKGSYRFKSEEIDRITKCLADRKK